MLEMGDLGAGAGELPGLRVAEPRHRRPLLLQAGARLGELISLRDDLLG